MPRLTDSAVSSRKDRYLSSRPSYAGIGGRESPPDILDLMTEAARFLAGRGFILRSGGACGADAAFEAGVKDETLKEIYLPWKGFNGNPSERYGLSDEAVNLAKQYHPAWGSLSENGKRLIARNSYQILGEDLVAPVQFVVCWTPGGALRGGTAQGIRIARSRQIAVFNLGHRKALEHVLECLKSNQVLAIFPL